MYSGDSINNGEKNFLDKLKIATVNFDEKYNKKIAQEKSFKTLRSILEKNLSLDIPMHEKVIFAVDFFDMILRNTFFDLVDKVALKNTRLFNGELNHDFNVLALRAKNSSYPIVSFIIEAEKLLYKAKKKNATVILRNENQKLLDIMEIFQFEKENKEQVLSELGLSKYFAMKNNIEKIEEELVAIEILRRDIVKMMTQSKNDMLSQRIEYYNKELLESFHSKKSKLLQNVHNQGFFQQESDSFFSEISNYKQKLESEKKTIQIKAVEAVKQQQEHGQPENQEVVEVQRKTELCNEILDIHNEIAKIYKKNNEKYKKVLRDSPGVIIPMEKVAKMKEVASSNDRYLFELENLLKILEDIRDTAKDEFMGLGYPPFEDSIQSEKSNVQSSFKSAIPKVSNAEQEENLRLLFLMRINEMKAKYADQLKGNDDIKKRYDLMLVLYEKNYDVSTLEKHEKHLLEDLEKGIALQDKQSAVSQKSANKTKKRNNCGASCKKLDIVCEEIEVSDFDILCREKWFLICTNHKLYSEYEKMRKIDKTNSLSEEQLTIFKESIDSKVNEVNSVYERLKKESSVLENIGIIKQSKELSHKYNFFNQYYARFLSSTDVGSYFYKTFALKQEYFELSNFQSDIYMSQDSFNIFLKDINEILNRKKVFEQVAVLKEASKRMNLFKETPLLLYNDFIEMYEARKAYDLLVDQKNKIVSAIKKSNSDQKECQKEHQEFTEYNQLFDGSSSSLEPQQGDILQKTVPKVAKFSKVEKRSIKPFSEELTSGQKEDFTYEYANSNFSSLKPRQLVIPQKTVPKVKKCSPLYNMYTSAKINRYKFLNLLSKQSVKGKISSIVERSYYNQFQYFYSYEQSIFKALTNLVTST